MIALTIAFITMFALSRYKHIIYNYHYNIKSGIIRQEQHHCCDQAISLKQSFRSILYNYKSIQPPCNILTMLPFSCNSALFSSKRTVYTMSRRSFSALLLQRHITDKVLLRSTRSQSCKSKYQHSLRRTLMRAVVGNLYARATMRPHLASLSRNTPDHSRSMALQARKFPAQFAQKDCYDRDKQGISWHEGSHIILYDDMTDKLVGLLTSSHGKNLPPGVYIAKVSAEKYDGTFISLKDPNDPTKKIALLDIDGNKIPDPNKGGQYLAVFPLQRTISEETKGYLLSQKELEVQYPYLKPYIQKYQSSLRKIVEEGHNKNNTKGQFSKKLGGKDDEPL